MKQRHFNGAQVLTCQCEISLVADSHATSNPVISDVKRRKKNGLKLKSLTVLCYLVGIDTRGRELDAAGKLNYEGKVTADMDCKLKAL